MTSRSIGASILEKAREADRRLRANPFCRRLIAGRLERDEYASWLVQLYKYIRFTVQSETALATAMSGRVQTDPGARAVKAYALHHAEEESLHDDHLVEDLAALWDVSVAEAYRRIDQEPTAPSVAMWESMVGVMECRFPEGMLGFGLALETLASLQVDEIRAAMLETRIVPEIESAHRFLDEHSSEIEGEHSEAGVAILNALGSVEARAAALYFASAGMALYEGIIEFLDQRFAAAVAPDRSSTLVNA